jgi:hypothetical protein
MDETSSKNSSQNLGTYTYNSIVKKSLDLMAQK